MSGQNEFQVSRETELYQRMDHSGLTKRHGVLYASVVAGHLFDGFAINMMGVVIAGIIVTYHLNPSQSGFMASSVFYGMCFGTLLIGPLVDRIGRKRGLLLAIAIYSVFSLLAALSTSFNSLVVFRILQGVGLGAEVPLTMTYVSEFMPTRYRGRAVASTTFFWTVAGVIAALLGLVLIPRFGWRSMFIAGFLPAVIVLVIRIWVPESVRFLVRKGKLDEAERVVDQLSTIPAKSKSDKSSQALTEAASVEPDMSIGRIFKGQYASLTIGVWLLLFICGFVFYGLGSWLPTIFMKMGFGFVRSLSYTAVITLAGAVGSVVGGTLIDKIGYRKTLISFFTISGLALMAWVKAPNATVMVLMGMITACFGFGAGGVVFTYVSSLYPTALRATGTGWAAFWQRAGGLVAPYVLGVIIQSNLPNYMFFFTLGIPTLIGALIAFGMTRELAGKSLEQIQRELSA